MESKIRIKLGQVEVEYEGSEAFIRQELLDLLEKVSDLYSARHLLSNGNTKGLEGGAAPIIELSTRSIATKLECKTGRDLVLAAAAHFTFSRATETFTRQQLLTEMQTARGRGYKKSYSNNMTKYLDGLVKDGDLIEPSTGTYSLSPDRRKTLEAQLAPGS